MDIFVRNVPQQSSDKQLRKFLRPHLEKLGVDVFHCNKFRYKPLALVTVLDPELAHRFLALYGDSAVRSTLLNTCELIYLGQTLHFSAGKKPPDPILLDTLRKEAKDKAENIHKGRSHALPAARHERKYTYLSLYCGLWDHKGSDLS